MDWQGRFGRGSSPYTPSRSMPRSMPGYPDNFPRSLNQRYPHETRIMNGQRQDTKDTNRDQTPQEPKSAGQVINKFATTTSFQGIPFIIRGSRWYSKGIWSLLFLAATGACLFHCYSIIDEYYKRKVNTRYEIGYDVLPFPSVTVCNINPVRLSRVALGGKELEKFVQSLQPQEEYNVPNASKPDLSVPPSIFTGSGPAIGGQLEIELILPIEQGPLLTAEECAEACLATCVFTDRGNGTTGYECRCPAGFLFGDDESCMDINECQGDFHGCNVECNNTEGSYFCTCGNTGMVLAIDNKTCVPENFDGIIILPSLDECGEVCSNGVCDIANASDTAPGGYFCNCFPGYGLNEGSCVDVDECLNGTHLCNVECVNTVGSFFCTCDNTSLVLSRDNNTCVEVPTIATQMPTTDEPLVSIEDCEQDCLNGTCILEIPTSNHVCVCPPGFSLSGQLCVDVDECLNGTHLCNVECVNTEGSFFCTCGNTSLVLSRDNKTCVEVLTIATQMPTTAEPLVSIEDCEQDCLNGTCVPEIPSNHVCVCPPGFSLSGQLCVDVDECLNGTHLCNVECVNTEGSFFCTCGNTDLVLSTDNKTCVEVPTIANQMPTTAEPLVSIEDCEQDCLNGTCVPEIPTSNHVCVCPPGFSLSGHLCVDVDECLNDTHLCNVECVNTEGSFFCTCGNTDLVLSTDNKTCVEVPTIPNEVPTTAEPPLSLENCEQDCLNGTCVPEIPTSSHVCVCPPGFSLSGQLCVDVDECLNGTHLCNVECVNTEGSHFCSCGNTGLVLSNDNKTCVDVPTIANQKPTAAADVVPIPTLPDCNKACDNGSCVPAQPDDPTAGYTCECPPGHVLQGVLCVDQDECQTGSHGCTSVCVNNIGSYTCLCDESSSSTLASDGRTCVNPDADYNPYPDLSDAKTDYQTYIVDEEEEDDGEISTEFKIAEEFKEIMSEISPEVRAQMGHQKEAMILSCSFNGRVCSLDSFVQHENPTYGNCYTFNHPETWQEPVKSKRSGSQYGLNLLLYTENHEQVNGLSNGQGMRVEVHPFDTKSFAEENGVSSAPGTATYMGLRMVNVKRRGDPYGECEDGEAFEKYYNKTYTVDACVNTCLDRKIHELCKCYRSEYQDYRPVEEYLQTTGVVLPPCNSETETKCEYYHRANMEVGLDECDCKQACQSTHFDLEQSHNSWPDISFWYSLVNRVCERDQYGCCALQQQVTPVQREEALRKNFISLRVYYRELNYETLSEVPAYETSQFLSDFGGTLGLWVGASILTIVEVIDLLVRLCFYCGRNNRPPRPPPRDMNGGPMWGPRPYQPYGHASPSSWTQPFFNNRRPANGFR